MERLTPHELWKQKSDSHEVYIHASHYDALRNLLREVADEIERLRAELREWMAADILTLEMRLRADRLLNGTADDSTVSTDGATPVTGAK